MNRKLPLWVTLLVVWIFCVITVIFGWAVLNIKSGKSNLGEHTKNSILFIARFPHLISKSFHEIRGGGTNLYISAHQNEGINGMKLSAKNYVDSNYLLLAFYNKAAHQSTVKLLRLSDQKPIHQWVPDVDKVLELYFK